MRSLPQTPSPERDGHVRGLTPAMAAVDHDLRPGLWTVANGMDAYLLQSIIVRLGREFLPKMSLCGHGPVRGRRGRG
jgi:hypothetical protein